MTYAIIIYLYAVGAVMQLFTSYLVLGLVDDEPFDWRRILANSVFWPVMFPAFLLWSHMRPSQDD